MPSCPNAACSKADRVILHGFYKTKSGKRRRYRCQKCGKTFCSMAGTPYHRLQHRRSTFDEVAALSVEGVSKSAIARVKGIGWNTVDRWLEKAAACCRRFSSTNIQGLEVQELQADEIRTIAGGKKQPVWIFTSIDVWSRLWPATVVGRRSYRNTRRLLREVRNRSRTGNSLLVVTDGFEFYNRAVSEVFGRACLHGQVIKTRRNDRVIKVDRELVRGAPWKLHQALADSEDSSTLNTSFIERLNLTIRQGSAYLCRRSLCHSRWKPRLEDHLELLRCHYNFVRPHRALKFGKETRTPAMQAGLAKRQFRLRDIFCFRVRLACALVYCVVFGDRDGVRSLAA
jgi:transposase-like protein/IS1 family transposase